MRHKTQHSSHTISNKVSNSRIRVKHIMKYSCAVASVFILCLALVACQEKPKEPKVGEPIFKLEGAGGGQNLRNFQAGFNGGIGTKVWEKRDKSLELGTSYGQGFARVDGHTFKSKPVYGIGATFRWGRKR